MSLQKRAASYIKKTGQATTMANEHKNIQRGKGATAENPQATVKRWNKGILHGPTSK